MPFSSLSDDYSDDCWTLSDEAFRLHTEAIVWSNRKLLDCVIPKDDVRRFAKHPESAEELVAHRYWTETADTYVIVHQSRYQRTKEAVLRQHEVNRENGAKGGRPPKAPREQFKPNGKTDSLTHSLSESVSDGFSGGKAGQPPEPPREREVSAGKTHSLSESPTERERKGKERHEHWARSFKPDEEAAS